MSGLSGETIDMMCETSFQRGRAAGIKESLDAGPAGAEALLVHAVTAATKAVLDEAMKHVPPEAMVVLRVLAGLLDKR